MHTNDPEASLRGGECGCRLEEELGNFGGVFAIAPVSDPNGIDFFGGPRPGLEDGHVSTFMQCPDIVEVQSFAIHRAQGLTAGEDAIEAVTANLLDLQRGR